MAKKSVLGAVFAVLYASIGFVGCKTLTATYLDANGKPFERSGLFYFWVKKMPYSFYEDKLQRTEVLRVYDTTRKVASWGGGKTSNYLLQPGGGVIVTESGSNETYTMVYVYRVTVTRSWYNRTTYFQDALPKTTVVYADSESSVLIPTRNKPADFKREGVSV
ncbi:MAG: hypothetical protein Pg6C_12510 [Treponemataceae bacterium]|nr:MAG: hypothetical protein Pg6C_12510 [Treponemataceae bacterium]